MTPAIPPTDPDVWDARAEVAVGVLICRYLAGDPPPPGSRCAADFADWAKRLQADGRARLSNLNASAFTLQEGGGETAAPGAGKDRLEAERWEAGRAERDEAKRAWRSIPTLQRERLLLQVLGDERLTFHDLTSRMNAELGYGPERRTQPVYVDHTRALVAPLFRSGQLEREPDPSTRRFRYRYFKKRPLEGAILDLERIYWEQDLEGGE